MSKMLRQMVQFTEPQMAYLRRRAAKLGVTIAELVRRIIDDHRERAPGKTARHPR
jgi:hypothetical protein